MNNRWAVCGICTSLQEMATFQSVSHESESVRRNLAALRVITFQPGSKYSSWVVNLTQLTTHVILVLDIFAQLIQTC